MRALLVEPNAVIAEAIGRQLDSAKISFERIGMDDLSDLIDGVDAPFHDYDAIIVGGVDHPTNCVAELRRHQVRAAVLCLIERRSAQLAADILDAGADDVMVKPVVNVEIRARIEATRRRTHGLTTNAVREGRLVVYLDGRDPEVDGVRLHLSQREHAILSVLALNHRRVVSKERIYESVYGLSGSDPLDKVIDVYICKLRKKIAEATGGAKYIETVYGRGYKFEAPADAEVAERRPLVSVKPQPMPIHAAARPGTGMGIHPAVLHAADR